MKSIVSLAKRRGFIFPSSLIYGGVEALWDYGPLGVAMKNNIKKEWTKMFVQGMENMEQIESSILMHPKVWEASGHIENFTDPLVDCRECRSRFRADHLIEGEYVGTGKAKKEDQCPECGSTSFTDARNFNLMFKTYLGPLEEEGSQTYLRPETAQGMFSDFKLVQETMRRKLPFGIAQYGKSFRNEITTGNFNFRSREFEIAEIEFFVKPGEDEEWFDWWVDRWEEFFLSLGLDKEKLRRYEHPKDSLSHYSKRTVDIEYHFPFGWKEIAGIANRTDFDLSRHMEHSGEDMRYLDPVTNERYVPYVIEPTLGIERLLLALLVDGHVEMEGGRSGNEDQATETMLKLSPKVAPVKVAVLPLQKNKAELTDKAKEVYDSLKYDHWCQFDITGSIGKRYRRQDEIGTLLCITIDFDSLENDDVTLRDRDTMEQVRIPIKELNNEISKRLSV